MQRHLFTLAVVAVASWGCSDKSSKPGKAPLTARNAIGELSKLVPPPAAPKDVPAAADWAAIEKQLGTALPPDYKALVATYGTGAFAGFLWVFNPFTANTNLALVPSVKRRLDSERAFRNSNPGVSSHPLHPAKGGLLPWAITDNGDTLFWLTTGSPEQWPTLVNYARSVKYHRYDVGCAKFLARWLAGSLKPTPFDGVFDKAGPKKRFETQPK